MHLLQFHNLIYILPMFAAMLLVLLLGLGVPGGEHGGAHFEVGHDVSHGLGGDAHAGSSHVGDVHGPAAAPMGVFGTLLSFVGIGKVPLVTVLVCFGLLWGIAGLSVNQFYSQAATHLWPAAGVAALVAAVGTGWVSNLVARLLPNVETYGSDTRELLSTRASVLHEIDARGGTARARDEHGNLRDVPVRVRQGQVPIARGREVTLIEYDEASGTFIAEVVLPDGAS